MATKRKPLFECQECGKKFYTVKAAERASFGDRGCPKCGGADIDIYVPPSDTFTVGLSDGTEFKVKTSVW